MTRKEFILIGNRQKAKPATQQYRWQHVQVLYTQTVDATNVSTQIGRNQTRIELSTENTLTSLSHGGIADIGIGAYEVVATALKLLIDCELSLAGLLLGVLLLS